MPKGKRKRAGALSPLAVSPLETIDIEIPEMGVSITLRRAKFSDRTELASLYRSFSENEMSDELQAEELRTYLKARTKSIRGLEDDRVDENGLLETFYNSWELVNHLGTMIGALFFRSRFPLAKDQEGSGGPGARSEYQGGSAGGSQVQGLPDNMPSEGLA